MRCFVLSKKGKALMPCHPARARQLLREGRAVVHRTVPYVIRLKDRKGGALQPLRVKIDPGSNVTGMALVRDSEQVDTATGEIRRAAHVVLLAELIHRGHAIRDALAQRRAFRRRRRNQLWHRPARFDNRTRPQGWLAPSLQHRVDTTMAWVRRFQRWAPVTAFSQELARFDTQALQNPEISGTEYQKGELFGYEVREYLLEKWGRRCAYCDAQNVPLQVEHISPRARGGSNRVSNLTLACAACNTAKGAQSLDAFLAHDPQRLAKIQAQAKAPLRDAAAVNSTRWALYGRLKETSLDVEVATGGRTKWNRQRLGIPKNHALDAACVGQADHIKAWQAPVLTIKATGRGSYQRSRLDRFGFVRGYLTRQKRHFGFQTGDLVKAEVPSGKKAGIHVGRVAVRATGSFNIQTPTGVVQGVSHRHCRMLQRGDGYGYSFTRIAWQKGGAGMGQVSPAALSLPGINAGVSRAN